MLGNVRSPYVVLDFGDPRDPAGPFVSVTSRPADRRWRPPRGALLEAALLSFNARLSDPGGFTADPGGFAVGPSEFTSGPGVFDPAPPLSPVEHALIHVEERRVGCVTRRQGTSFAAYAFLSAEVLPPGPGSSGTLVSVAGRGIAVSDLRLAAVPDLDLLAAAALEQIGQRGDMSEFAAGTGPIRFGAIQELLQVSLGIPGSARHAEVRPWMMELRTRWAEAHRAQMHFSGQDPEAAAQALLALLDQMQALSTVVPWWREAGAVALAESVRHAVFASDVPSRPAQDLWRLGVTSPGIEARWLHAWQRWYSQRNLI